jgi:hypothetical protein
MNLVPSLHLGDSSTLFSDLSTCTFHGPYFFALHVMYLNLSFD